MFWSIASSNRWRYNTAIASHAHPSELTGRHVFLCEFNVFITFTNFTVFNTIFIFLFLLYFTQNSQEFFLKKIWPITAYITIFGVYRIQQLSVCYLPDSINSNIKIYTQKIWPITTYITIFGYLPRLSFCYLPDVLLLQNKHTVV